MLSPWLRATNGSRTNRSGRISIRSRPESAFAFGDEQVEKILRLTGVGRAKVLDLCCGPGRHTVALAKRGFAVTAVDRTRFIINLFTSFGYFEDQADDFRVLELVRENLRPSGVFFLEMVSKER